MGTRTLIFLILGLIIFWGLRTIMRDWRKKFAQDDKEAERKRLAQLARNKKEAKKPGVVELERDKDGIYRPKDKGRDGDR